MSYRVLSYTSSAAEQYAVDMPSQEGISAVRDFPMSPLEWKPVAETWAGTANKPLRNRLIRVVREAPWKYGEDVQLLLRVDHEHHFEDAMRRKLVQIR